MIPSFLPLVLLLIVFVVSLKTSFSLRLSHPPILTVRGDGIAPLSVDESEITATIQSRIESPTPIVQANELNRTLLSLWIKTVQNKTAMISDKVKNYLQTPSIESIIKKLRTTSLSTTPLTQWKDGLMFYYGAESSHTFAFQTSVNASGPIIDELIRIGVTRIDNVRLVSSDESQRLSRMAAIANATKNAWGKIKAAVEPFGWNIGELKQKDSNNIIDIDGLLIQENENPKNVNVEILSINVEGVTIRPPPQPREMLSSVGFASRMDESMIAPMVPPMPPSSTVFASDATMSASIVLRVRLTKINNSTSSNIRTMEGEITTASAHNNNNNRSNRMTIDKIIRSSTGLPGATGVIIADNNNNDNNNNNNNNNYLNAELDEEETEQMMMNPNDNNY